MPSAWLTVYSSVSTNVHVNVAAYAAANATEHVAANSVEGIVYHLERIYFSGSPTFESAVKDAQGFRIQVGGLIIVLNTLFYLLPILTEQVVSVVL